MMATGCRRETSQLGPRVEVRVERADCRSGRMTRPPLQVRRECTLRAGAPPVPKLGGKLPPRTAKLAVPPGSNRCVSPVDRSALPESATTGRTSNDGHRMPSGDFSAWTGSWCSTAGTIPLDGARTVASVFQSPFEKAGRPSRTGFQPVCLRASSPWHRLTGVGLEAPGQTGQRHCPTFQTGS